MLLPLLYFVVLPSSMKFALDGTDIAGFYFVSVNRSASWLYAAFHTYMSCDLLGT